MSSSQGNQASPGVQRPDRERLLARVPKLVEEIAVGAVERERDRVLPFEAFRLWRESGLGALRVPSHLGGPGGTVRDYVDTIAAIASADSNVAHALRLHFNYVESQVLAAPDRREPQALARILAGAVFGGAHTEQSTERPGEITTRLSREGEGFRLNGRKWYATGTAFADYATFSALNEHGEAVNVLLPVSRQGIAILDDWDGMGQRLTASGGVVLDQVPVHREEIFKRESDSLIGRHTSTLRQLHLAACAGGIVRNVLADAIDYVHRQARAAAHSPASSAREDHFVQQVIGEIAARSLAIDAVLGESAATLDHTVDAFARGDGEEIEAALVAGSLTTSRTQLVIANLGLQAAEKMFEVGGGSATSRRYNFDRHWRNLRTVLNHNPLLHKARVIGDYYLNGTTTHLKEGRVF